MVLWFARGLRRGVVTTRYPDGPPDGWAGDLPTPPVFDPARLTRELAEELTTICPSGALRREGAELRYDIGACTACRRCFGVRPGVVRASGEFELAATRREHLIKRFPLREGGDEGD